MARTKPPAAKLFVLLAIFCFTSGRAQNIVHFIATDLAANPAKLTEMDFSEFIVSAPDFGQAPRGPEALHAAEKLEKHVTQFLEGHPWKPFQHTLGISGYEVYF